MPDNSWVLHGAQAGRATAEQPALDETTPLSPMPLSSSGAGAVAAKGELAGWRNWLLMALTALGVAGVIAGGIVWGLHREGGGGGIL